MNRLRVVLQILRENLLFARKSKCYFVVEQVEYLGHIIGKDGVATYASKPCCDGVFRLDWLFQKVCKRVWDYGVTFK